MYFLYWLERKPNSSNPNSANKSERGNEKIHFENVALCWPKSDNRVKSVTIIRKYLELHHRRGPKHPSCLHNHGNIWVCSQPHDLQIPIQLGFKTIQRLYCHDHCRATISCIHHSDCKTSASLLSQLLSFLPRTCETERGVSAIG